MDHPSRWIWATDIHLNHVAVAQWDHWINFIRDLVSRHESGSVQGLILTGDLSESDDVVFQLCRIVEAIDLPLFFVLGNHDFYNGSISQTRQSVVLATGEDPQLHYLSDTSAVALSPQVFLVGEDGWGDGTVGDYENSPVRMNDFLLIEDFHARPTRQWPRILSDLGSQSADRLRQKLLTIPDDASQVLVATHVPPFREACWYEGKTADDHWAPFFVCGKVGGVLQWFHEERPNIELTVICGHTHHRGFAQISDRLSVYTGHAEYGHPTVQSVIEIPGDGESIRLIDVAVDGP